MAYTRVSPGVWRDQNGRTIKSITDPNKGASSPGKPGGKGGKPAISSTGPLGSSTIRVDKNGNVTGADTLSPGNAAALGGIQGSSVSASDALKGFLTGAGTPGSPTSGLEDAVFNQLTGKGRVTGVDQTYARDQEQLQQTLANRGIPVGSQLYDEEMAKLKEGRDVNYEQARNQATQTAWGQLPTLSGIGTAGFIAPNQPDVASIFAALKQAGVNEDQIRASIQIANINHAHSGGGGGRSGGGGGGGSPFFNGPPPGA